MDNVFEILIYVIIIISFLSSIFKKKKQQQQQPPAQQPRQEDYYQAEKPEESIPRPQQKEEYDIMRELEDFFKVGDESTKQQIPIPGPQEKSKIPDNEEHTRSESWKAPTESEHKLENWERKKIEVKKIISSVDASIEKKAAMFEQSLDKKGTTYSTFALRIKSQMKNPSTLKDYIIFSEILGKPKALRR